MAQPADTPYPTAIALLARREHSARELVRKLRDKGYDEAAVRDCIEQLQRERLQSDERYAESYAASRAGKGYGPLRIRAELIERGVDESVIDAQFASLDVNWDDLAAQVRRKRFGARLPKDFKERAQQSRFLQYRGFAHEQIRAAFNDDFE